MNGIPSHLSILVVIFMTTSYASAEILFEDDFESGDTSHTESGIRWTDKVNVVVNSSNPKAGNYSARMLYNGNTDLSEDAFTELRFDLGTPKQTVWLKYDLYIPHNYYHRDGIGSDNNKGFFHLWNGNYNTAKQLTYINWWPTSSGKSSISNGWKTNDNVSRHRFDQNDINNYEKDGDGVIAIDPQSMAGRWVEVIIHCRAADIGVNNGATQIWLDNNLIWSVVDANNHYIDNIDNANLFTAGYILGWSNSGFNEDTAFFLDNVVFATSKNDFFTGPNPPSNIVTEK